MQCKNCGAELSLIDGNYKCEFCGASFLHEEITPIKLQDSNKFRIVSGVLLSYYGNETIVTIPANVYVIGNSAFKNNLAIKKVIFSSTVNAIENNAFEGCLNLIEIENYSNISRYGDECFKFSGLKQVSIGRKVQTLGVGCFSRMPNLKVVIYMPEKIIKLNHTFAFCPNLCEVKEKVHNFFPSLHTSIELKNNPTNKRPTLSDAFVGTKYITIIKEQYFNSVKQRICPECGGKVTRCIFHARCQNCDIDYKN